MKKGLLIALMLCICGFVNAQRVFTLVYAISDDGFVNIRATPSASGKVVGQVYVVCSTAWATPKRLVKWTAGLK